MNTETFNKLLDELDGNSLETLKQKNAKYASENDCLHNFEMGAEIMGSTPAQCAWGYLTKHLVALRDMVERDDFSDREDFLEKCQDIINYIRFIWVIGNDREGYVALDKFEDYLKRETKPESNWRCEICKHYHGDPECRTCTTDVDEFGNDTSTPSNFEVHETRMEHSCESCAHRGMGREPFSRYCVSCTTISGSTPSHWKSAADLEE